MRSKQQEEDLRQQNEDIRQLSKGIQRTQLDCQRMMDYEDSQFINTIATAISSDKEQEIRHLKIELAEARPTNISKTWKRETTTNNQ